MKLLLCVECQDVVKLISVHRTCQCGKSWGQYLEDGLNATIGGRAVPLGFDNRSLVAALKKRPEYGQGKEFTSFVIPKRCPTITEEKGKK